MVFSRRRSNARQTWTQNTRQTGQHDTSGAYASILRISTRDRRRRAAVKPIGSQRLRRMPASLARSRPNACGLIAEYCLRVPLIFFAAQASIIACKFASISGNQHHNDWYSITTLFRNQRAFDDTDFPCVSPFSFSRQALSLPERRAQSPSPRRRS